LEVGPVTVPVIGPSTVIVEGTEMIPNNLRVVGANEMFAAGTSSVKPPRTGLSAPQAVPESPEPLAAVPIDAVPFEKVALNVSGPVGHDAAADAGDGVGTIITSITATGAAARKVARRCRTPCRGERLRLGSRRVRPRLT
jgi:hypothetical protein